MEDLTGKRATHSRHPSRIIETKGAALMQKITPFLWFDNNAEEAMKFYTSVFKNSRIGKVTLYPDGSPGPAGTVMVGTFQIEGQEFIALNGGPVFKFTEAISFVVNCETQEEVDEYWTKLTARGGKEVECGWLKDKFGLSWQIVPTILNKLMGDKDPEKSKRVMQAMLKMKKIDIEGLKRAYAQQ
jgi:predicted 3-demethylubiquinone-9 3-methyltransferase (glyoxalase superfamily)